MDAEEEEPHHVPNVDSSLQLEDTPVTTATDSELQDQNTESRSELESATSAVSPVAEKEEEGKGNGVVDVEVAVGDEGGGGDLIVGEEKHGMSNSGVDIKGSSPVDGDKEGGDGEDSHVEGEKVELVEDAAVDDEMDKMEDAANVSDERLTAEGIEVSVAEQQVVKLAEEAGNSVEQKVADDANDRLEVPEEKAVADVADERGTEDAAEVDGAEETSVEVRDPTEQTVVKEETGIVEEREVADVYVKSELLVDNKVEQSGEIMDKTGVDNIAEKSEFPEKPVVDLIVPSDVAGEIGTDLVEKGGTLEEKMMNNQSEQTEKLDDIRAVGEVGTDMAEPEDPVMEGKMVNNVSEQTENLEDIHAAGEAGTDMSEAEEDPVMEGKTVYTVSEQTENLEDINAVGEAGTDMAEAEEDPVMEEKMVTNVPEQIENLEDIRSAGEASRDMAEAEDPVMEEESDKEDTELGNAVEDVDEAEETETETETAGTAEVMEAADDTEMPDMTEELEIEAAEEMEGTEEIETSSKASGGKRKRGKNSSTKVQAKAPSRKKAEEDVCFICFDGGALVLCDRRGCPKAYHPACVGRDEAFFQSRGKWNCVKIAGVGFSEGTGSSVFSFAQDTIKVLHAPRMGVMALKRIFEV